MPFAAFGIAYVLILPARNEDVGREWVTFASQFFNGRIHFAHGLIERGQSVLEARNTHAVRPNILGQQSQAQAPNGALLRDSLGNLARDRDYIICACLWLDLPIPLRLFRQD